MQGISIKQLWKETPFTFIMMALNIFVFILQLVLSVGISDNYLEVRGAINKIFVLEFNEWYRIITAGFLHGSIMHIFFNVIFGLGVLTGYLERIIGSSKTAIIYFVSMILSGLLVVFLSDAGTWTLGASGAIFGALGSLVYIMLFRADLMDPRSAASIRSILIINIVFTFIAPNISIYGHIGGVVAGFMISFLFIDRDKSEYEIYH